MAATSSRDMVITWNGVPLAPYFNEATLERMADILETTVFGATAKTKLGALLDGKISAKGLFDGTGDAALAPNIGVTAAFTFKTSSATNSVSNPAYSGSMILAKYNISGSVDGLAEADVEFEITGPVTRATS